TLAIAACGLGFVVVFVSNQAHLLRRPVTWIVGYVEFALKGATGRTAALQEAVRLQPVLVPGIAFPSFGLWFYAPCFPLVWVWLYGLSGTLIRYATARGILHAPGRAVGLLDIDASPLHTVGVVAAGLVSVVYWTAVFWRRWCCARLLRRANYPRQFGGGLCRILRVLQYVTLALRYWNARTSEVRALRATTCPALRTHSFSTCSVMACSGLAASSTTRSARHPSLSP